MNGGDGILVRRPWNNDEISGRLVSKAIENDGGAAVWKPRQFSVHVFIHFRQHHLNDILKRFLYAILLTVIIGRRYERHSKRYARGRSSQRSRAGKLRCVIINCIFQRY